MQDRISATLTRRRPTAVLATAALALLALAPAGAAAKAPTAAKSSNWNATVIAKDTDRGRLVTAGRGGDVRTVHASKRAANVARLGQRVKVRGQRQADGTYQAERLRRNGKAKRTRIRGAVVERSSGRYLVSAGGSVFSIRAKSSRKARAASSDGVGAGDLVVADVELTGDGLVERRVRDVGDVSTIEVEGLFLELGDGVLKVAVEKRGLVEIAVPADMTVQPPAPGDEVELLASIGPDGALTLVAFDADDDDGIDFDAEDGEAEIEGVIADLTAEAVTVQSGGGTLTCAIPAGVTLTGFAVGDAVEMECLMVGGAFTLRELESETDEFEHEDDDEQEDENEDDDEDDDDSDDDDEEDDSDDDED